MTLICSCEATAEIQFFKKRNGFTYLYLLTEPRDPIAPDTIRYVGKTMARPLIRYHLHLNDAQRGSTHCNRWIKNVLDCGQKPRMHIIGIVPSEYGGRAEARLISSLRKSGARLTNICDGGEGTPGHIVSEETRRKISRAQRGVKEKISPSEETRRLWRERSKRRWATPESRKRHSIQLKGMIFTAERRRRISEALIGRKLSPEHRAKSAVAMLGKKHSPETRAKMKASHKKRLQDPEYRKKLSVWAKVGWETRRNNQLAIPRDGELL